MVTIQIEQFKTVMKGDNLMAFDGFVLANVVSELNHTIVNGRIYKIYQPENDELVFIIKNNKENYRLFLSANASLPFVYLSNAQKSNPQTAPNFCMLLRKHLGNGRIVSIEQPQMERIVIFTIEHLNEMGDLCQKKLIIELMGKHSNIIFVNDNDTIIDSIKHIGFAVSSVREVLPGRPYSFPPNQGKISLLDLNHDIYTSHLLPLSMPCAKAIYSSFCGISPALAQELCYRAGIEERASLSELSKEKQDDLYHILSSFSDSIKKEDFTPSIFLEDNKPKDFSSTSFFSYSKDSQKTYESISDLLEYYYYEKNLVTKIRQKSTDLRKIVANAIERTSKKYDLQLAQLKDTEKRDKYRIYGELLTTYGYEIKEGETAFKTINYYTGEEVKIPLDPTLSPIDNAKKYFEKYNKLKRTFEALTELTVESKSELEHLLSIKTSLDIALLETDLIQVKQELMDYGYIKKKGTKGKKNQLKSKPFHYLTKEGFHIYVGKNNFQNDELSFSFATGNDLWFHSKGMPGSHVILKTEGKEEIPDAVYEQAARLAAYYSNGRTAPKVEIDYTRKKNLKKPPASKPGFVIYHTNYSMLVEPDITDITLVEEH